MEEDTDVGIIMLLPNEIIAMILHNLHCRDIVNFGATCKRYYEFVHSTQYVWKEKFKQILPLKISNIVEMYGNANWLDEIKRFYVVKRDVYKELMAMSPKYYWRTSEISLEDVRSFFLLAVGHNTHFHYVVFILQEIIYSGTTCADSHIYAKLFTMTDVYYAKMIVRYLMQTYMTVKWVHGYMRNELTPEVVLNFFVQWTDPLTMHLEDGVRLCIMRLVTKVDELFPKEKYPGERGHGNVRDKLAKGVITERQILEAISEVIYNSQHLSIMAGASLNGLDIEKVCRNGCGNLIVAAAMYQAVANSCGVELEIIAFPNHLFLEWRSPMQPRVAYKIDLLTGNLIPQGRCPFASASYRNEYRYDPDNFMQYVVAAFLTTMGAIKNWHTENAVFLLDFLSNNVNDDNPYRDFLPTLQHLLDVGFNSQLGVPIGLEYVQDVFMNIIHTLAYLNKDPIHFTREAEIKHHESSVTFAIGMLAYHKKYEYLCVVRGWDLTCTTDWCRQVESKDLQFGSQQPFYTVIAVDQSERYVAQENLVHVDRPTRLYHLEDIIAKEFTHFDGYCYVPNAEKIKEYPEDEPIRNLYRTRAHQRAAELREDL